MSNHHKIPLILDVSLIGMEFNEFFKVNSLIQDGFIETFKDRNRLHVSNEYAQSVGYKSKVMHGNILNGFISYFVGETLANSNLKLMTQSIRFKNPVYLNDLVQLTVILNDISASTNMYLFGFEFENENKQIVADGKFQCIQIQ
jgi:3-hydroxybutyryl-CoA dehydratase